MKLVKLSLATAMVAGAFSAVNAVSLEEAIKDVDVSGFGRYRYDSTNVKVDGDKEQGAAHRFTSVVNFKLTLDDNFFGMLGLKYDNKDLSGEHHGNGGITSVKSGSVSADNGYSSNGEIDVRQIYLGYQAGNTIIQGGRQELGTFFTDDMVGTGIKVLNLDIPGLILAAVAFDDLEDDVDISSANGSTVILDHVGLNAGVIKPLNDDSATYQNNLYGVAAIGNYDPVSFQVWYAYLANVTSLYAIDASVNIPANDNVSFGVHGQFTGSLLESDFKDNIKNNGSAALGIAPAIDLVDDATFWAVEATANLFGLNLNAGYLDFSTDKDKMSVISFEDQGGFISPGQDLLDYRLFSGKNKYWFVTALYTFAEKFSVGADYINGENKYSLLGNEGKFKNQEIVGRIGYQHSKKLGFNAFYSHIERDARTDLSRSLADKEKDDHFRFEAKYSF